MMEIALLILGLSFILLPLFVLSLQLNRKAPPATVFHMVIVEKKPATQNPEPAKVIQLKPLAKVIPISRKKDK